MTLPAVEESPNHTIYILLTKMLIFYLFLLIIYFFILLFLTRNNPNQKQYLWGGLAAFLIWMAFIIYISFWSADKFETILTDPSIRYPTDLIKHYEDKIFWTIIASFFVLHILLPIGFKYIITKKQSQK